MFELLQKMQSASATTPEHRVQHVRFDAFWAMYDSACRGTHSAATRARLRGRYEHTIHALFGVRTLSNMSLEPTGPVLTYTLDDADGSARVVFRPDFVEDVAAAQRDACLALARVWLGADEIDVRVDLRNLSGTKVRQLARQCTVADLRNGMALFETLPCRIRQVVIVQPTHIFGWTLAKRAIRGLIARQLGVRCLFCEPS